MHFFNPAPVMKLVEVVAGRALRRGGARRRARELGRAMGRHVIDAADGPGFLVNRCNRPFGLEALRLVQEGLATRRAGRPHLPPRRRLPHGPVRADGPRRDRRRLRGLEVVLRAVVRRAALAPLDARRAQGGRRATYGRKTGRGWYEYPEDGEHRPPDPDAARGRRRRPRRDRAAGRRWPRSCARPPRPPAGSVERGRRQVPALVVDCGGHDEEDPPLQGGPQVILCDAGAARRARPGGQRRRLLRRCRRSAALVELTRSPTTSAAAARAAEAFFALARPPRRVGRRRARARARPDRRPAGQRGVLRARRRRRLAGGHRRRHGARPQPPARPARVGRRDRPRRGARRAGRRCARSTARSATAPRPRCCGRSAAGTPLRS